jgi:CRISPR-associated protein Cmr1
MPLAGGDFVPIALWLFRGYPKGGNVVLKWKGGSVVSGSEAPFDKLAGKGEGDKLLFATLRGEKSLEDAFLSWLCEAKQLTELR